MAGRSAADIARLTSQALEDVHLADKADDYPHQLSGGQKQRVALARGIVNRPRVLLLDEPLGALDAKLREEMQVELITLQREVGITFVFVTHAQYEALALSHRIAVMNRGRVEQLDAPAHIYGAPRNRFVASFIGKISLLDCTVLACAGEHLRLDVRGIGEVVAPSLPGLGAGQRGAFALRPEQVKIGAPGEHAELPNRRQGTVFDYLYIGDVTTYIVQLDAGARLSAMLPNSAPGRAKFFEPGDRVELAWPAATGAFLAD
jgi:spermidine/putrescine transport system ATP-binding protein